MEDKEFTERYTIHRMAEQEIVAAFDCGDEDLNGFILTDAPLYRKEKLAVTYTVFEKSNHNHIVAFFSLSNDRISISDFDSKTKYNRFSRRFNNHKRLKSYPAAKIGRLGVSESLKGMNIGSMLLKFIKLYFTTDNKTGCPQPYPSTSAMASCHSTKRMPTNPRGCSTSTSTTWTKIDRHANTLSSQSKLMIIWDYSHPQYNASLDKKHTLVWELDQGAL